MLIYKATVDKRITHPCIWGGGGGINKMINNTATAVKACLIGIHPVYIYISLKCWCSIVERTLTMKHTTELTVDNWVNNCITHPGLSHQQLIAHYTHILSTLPLPLPSQPTPSSASSGAIQSQYSSMTEGPIIYWKTSHWFGLSSLPFNWT